MSLASFPEVALHHVSAFLSAPDVLRFLSTSVDMAHLGMRPTFWAALLASQLSSEEEGTTSSFLPLSEESSMKSGSSYRYFKDLYLQMAHRNALRSVEWKPVAGTEEAGTPSAREGHMSCILADRYLVVTGGYTDDRMVHVKDLHHPEEDFVALEPSSPPTTPPEDDSSSNTNTLSFAYGATLTPINRHQALRFGGFRTCGYSSECSQVALLTISSVESDVGKCHLSAHWHVVPTNVMLRDARGELRPTIMKDEYLARAYHTATFLYDRYLLILGGMQSTKSIWDPAILDTQTWTWLLPPTSSSSSTVSNGGPSHPSPRHGHSTIWDVKRSRLLVFGGGNGNDLLRSGQDNTEVWSTTYDLCSSASGARSSAPKDTQSLSSSSLLDLTTAWRPVAEESNLSPAEALCLGRCHESHRVSPDTVLLLCGSGRPSTNGVLAFNLSMDSFFRPAVQGPLPSPRFTTTSVLWNSYVILHGGFTSQRSTSLGDLQVLDLAPALQRPLRVFRPAGVRVPFFLPVTSEQVMELRQRRMISMEDLVMMNLRHASSEEQIRQSLFLLFAGQAHVYGGEAHDVDDEESYGSGEENLDAEFEE